MEFSTNNGGIMRVTQIMKDGNVYITKDNDLKSAECISSADFVMLINLYRYTKQNDIRNEWINPNGKNIA